MDHLAIMKKSWGLTKKILSGEKTIETRWYKNKYKPWDQIRVGEIVYFKDSGDPVTVKATVAKVEQFENFDEIQIKNILTRYSAEDLRTTDIAPEIINYTTGKKFCIVIHLTNPQPVEPFAIDKTGYGAMSSWICVEDINQIKSTYII